MTNRPTPLRPPAGVLLMALIPPGNRHTALTIAAIVSIICCLILPVSAVIISDETYTEYIDKTVKSTPTSHHGTNPIVPISGICITQSLGSPALKMVTTSTATTYMYNYATLPESANAKFDIYLSNRYGQNVRFYGTGEYGYFKSTVSGQNRLNLWVSFDNNCDYSIITRNSYLKFVNPDRDFIYPTMQTDYYETASDIPSFSGFTTDTSGHLAAFGGHYKDAYGDYIGVSHTAPTYSYIIDSWVNRVVVDETHGIVNRTDVTLYRNAYSSDFYVSYKNGGRQSIAQTVDVMYTADESLYPVSYALKSVQGTWYNKTFFADSGGDPAGPFSLTLSPASVQVGETVTATLLAAAAAPHYSYIVWSCTPDDHPDMATWSYRIQDVNGTWYERAANGDEIPISSADALTYQATPAYPGGHHIGVTIYDHHPPCQGLEQRATLAKPFEALYKSGSSPVRIQVIDERTGGLIAGSHIQVIDSQLPPFEGTGVNPIIDTTLPQGSEMFYLQRNAYDEPRYRIFADADGYRQVTENQWFSVNPSSPNTVTTVQVQMAAAAAPPEDPNNAYVTFRIRDEDGNPVKEARVTLDRWTRFALGTRPVTFEVPRGTYQYTVEPIDPGLYPATGSVTVGEEDSYEVNVVLSRTPGPGDDPGATPPPGPPPDRRTNEEKGQAVIDMIADNAEGIGALALICLLMGLLKLMVKW